MSVEALPQTAADKAADKGKRERLTRGARRRARQRAAGEMRLRVSLCRDGVTQKDPSPQEISAALKEDANVVVWADVQGDPTSVLQRLSDTYHLPHSIQEGLLDENARARMLESRDIYTIVVNGIGFDEQAEDAITSKIDIVFGQGFVLTLHREPAEWLDRLWSSAHKDAGSEGLMARGVARLLHTILDTLVDTYFPVIDRLDDLIDQLEDATVNDTSNTVQVRLFRMKRAVATLRRVISPQVELTNSLITRTGALVPSDVEPYFADVRDHTVRVFEMLDSYRDLLSGLLDVYLTTVSNRLNVVMKQLTIIATIFMPITFITGVFGMNFGHMPQVEHDA
ncbi:MAG TPA: magnesium transporter CorA family protein, partial [Ktedonobacterales bacterium]